MLIAMPLLRILAATIIPVQSGVLIIVETDMIKVKVTGRAMIKISPERADIPYPVTDERRDHCRKML
jgi:hypothetical protein